MVKYMRAFNYAWDAGYKAGYSSGKFEAYRGRRKGNMKTCNENWHIFEGGLPKTGDICKCGKKRATEVVGVVEDV